MDCSRCSAEVGCALAEVCVVEGGCLVRPVPLLKGFQTCPAEQAARERAPEPPKPSCTFRPVLSLAQPARLRGSFFLLRMQMITAYIYSGVNSCSPLEL